MCVPRPHVRHVNHLANAKKLNNVEDLNLETEILPLFDYTLNDLSRETLQTLFREPLPSVADIEHRHQIIRAFIANRDILGDYSYSKLDFNEVHRFLREPLGHYVHGLRFKLLFSESTRHRLRSGLAQLIVFFHRLHAFYFRRLKAAEFPPTYRSEIHAVNEFLASFNLDFYNRHITDDDLTISHIIDLVKLVSEKQGEDEFITFYRRLSSFEAYLSISKATFDNGFCFPDFSATSLSLELVFHPLLKTPVRNNLSSERQVVLLTGPNMSGKSTFLKSVGLCVFLAHLGVSAPAAQVTLPFYDHISISINHNDDLVSGYSHFMIEIMRLKQVLVEAAKGRRCFAVFDELFKGTNIEDAVQISTTTINGLTRFRNCFFLVSTHLHQLRDIEQVRAKEVDTYYFDCELYDDIPTFTYEIKEGWSDMRVGQLLFRKEGLDELLEAKLSRDGNA